MAYDFCRAYLAILRLLKSVLLYSYDNECSFSCSRAYILRGSEE